MTIRLRLTAPLLFALAALLPLAPGAIAAAPGQDEMKIDDQPGSRPAPSGPADSAAGNRLEVRQGEREGLHFRFP